MLYYCYKYNRFLFSYTGQVYKLYDFSMVIETSISNVSNSKDTKYDKVLIESKFTTINVEVSSKWIGITSTLKLGNLQLRTSLESCIEFQQCVLIRTLRSD